MSKLKKVSDPEADFQREVRVKQGYYNLMTQRALAESSGIPQSTLSKRLANPEDLTVAELRKLVASIIPDPVAILALVGYDERSLKPFRNTQVV